MKHERYIMKRGKIIKKIKLDFYSTEKKDDGKSYKLNTTKKVETTKVFPVKK